VECKCTSNANRTLSVLLSTLDMSKWTFKTHLPCCQSKRVKYVRHKTGAQVTVVSLSHWFWYLILTCCAAYVQCTQCFLQNADNCHTGELTFVSVSLSSVLSSDMILCGRSSYILLFLVRITPLKIPEEIFCCAIEYYNPPWHLYILKYLSICSWQFGLFSASERIFTLESCKSLLLRSSSLRTQFEDWRTDDKLSQQWTVRLQRASLKESRTHTSTIRSTNTSTLWESDCKFDFICS